METEEAVIFRRTDLPYVSFAALEDMRQKHELCDLTLKVRSSTFAAHRVILAAGIPYFRTVFTKTGSETKPKEIAIGDVDPAALECLIHYAYTGQVKISKENAVALLLASDTLQLSEVTSACIEFLSERLRLDNILSVRTFALTFNNSKLADNCNKYIEQNFEEFCRSDEFLSLPYSDILDIVTKDELNVSAEEIVYEAVINWVKFSPLERQENLHALLSAIRMFFLPISYLVKQVATEKLIRASIRCMELIQDVQSYHLLPKDEPEFLKSNVQPRTKTRMRNGMYAVCSIDDEYTVYNWDFVRETWHELISVEAGEMFLPVHGVVCVNDSMYIFLDETIEKFHTKTLEREVLTECAGVLGAAILLYGKVIYCFGSVEKDFESKVRSFDTDEAKWLVEKEMKTPRYDSAVVSLDSCIFVTGGYRTSHGYTDVVEKYNPATDCWCEMSSMLTARCSHGCAVINKKIYVCGGSVNGEITGTAEAYDSLINEWYHIAPMSTQRFWLSLVSYAGKLYALGGEIETERNTCVVEVYETENDKWAPGSSAPEGLWACCINVCN